MADITKSVLISPHLYCLPWWWWSWAQAGWLAATHRRASVSNSRLSNSRPRTEARAGVVWGNQKRVWNSSTKKELSVKITLWHRGFPFHQKHVEQNVHHSAHYTVINCLHARQQKYLMHFLAFNVTLKLQQDWASCSADARGCLVLMQYTWHRQKVM